MVTRVQKGITGRAGPLQTNSQSVETGLLVYEMCTNVHWQTSKFTPELPHLTTDNYNGSTIIRWGVLVSCLLNPGY
jgi:hypothetical protein